MIRQAQIAFIRAEALRLFEAQLDSSARYYACEYKSAAQLEALEEDAAISSAARELHTIYGMFASRDHIEAEVELADSVCRLRERNRGRVADLLADVLARIPREAIAA